MKIIVYHAAYGCDTGCCGHIVKMGDEEQFTFTHPDGEDNLAFAKDLVRGTFGEEHVRDLDWENCEIVDNCL